MLSNLVHSYKLTINHNCTYFDANRKQTTTVQIGIFITGQRPIVPHVSCLSDLVLVLKCSAIHCMDIKEWNCDAVFSFSFKINSEQQLDCKGGHYANWIPYIKRKKAHEVSMNIMEEYGQPGRRPTCGFHQSKHCGWQCLDFVLTFLDHQQLLVSCLERVLTGMKYLRKRLTFQQTSWFTQLLP